MSPFLLLETRRVGTRKIPLNKNLKGNIRRTNTFDKCSSTEYKDQIFHNFFHHFLLLNGFKCRTMWYVLSAHNKKGLSFVSIHS